MKPIISGCGGRVDAKKTAAAFKIALSSSRRRTVALSDLISASSALVAPGRCPPSTLRHDDILLDSNRSGIKPGALHPSQQVHEPSTSHETPHPIHHET